MANGDDDNRDAAADHIRASAAGFARLFHSPEFEAKAAMAMGSDAVMALVNRHAARTEELEAVVLEQTAALEEMREALERLHLERDQERTRLTSEQQRLTEERDGSPPSCGRTGGPAGSYRGRGTICASGGRSTG